MEDKTAEVQSLIRTIQIPAISKAALQSICAVNGIPKTGNKSDLQRRIINHINNCASERDWGGLNEVRKSIQSQTSIFVAAPLVSQSQPQPQPQPHSQPQPRAGPLPKPGFYSAARPQTPPNYAMPPYNSAGYAAPNGLRSHNQPSLPYPGASNGTTSRLRPSAPLLPPGIYFKPSPFYELQYQVGDIKTLEGPVMAAHRNAERITIRAQDHAALQQPLTDPSFRVMVFCAAGNTGFQDIAFPYQCELKVNGGDIKANLRGVKNKPGSTRPVDITDLLRLKPAGYANTVEFTYALTQKKFYLSVVVCKTFPVEDLVTRIQKKIRKEFVVAEITKKANDPDVVATSQNLSLKCPITYMRLRVPCRALSCNHIQCFDATSYLQLQEQGPQWICPICNKPAPFDQLAIDEYAREILAKTSDSVEQVTIETDGKWTVPGAKRDETPKRQEASYVDDDDVIVSSEVTKMTSRNTETPSLVSASASTPYLGTPASAVSADISTGPRSSSKRPAPEVIDLTLSDDDEPPRPVKRANYGNNGYPGSSY
ncbi:E3 SUMO-protein ligase pli1 [Madurella fahalii]|uniref:E3 SUMO-protein ligase pli1 n=1 Tax=Madurella fahalii TaxID=1157608 RepID=A0ABQ0GSR0_9PEZI